MKYLFPILVLIAGLIAGFVGGVWISGDAHIEPVQALKTYICPMHPTVVSDKPGSCPICGMDLVKKEADASSAQNGNVQIDPTTIQNIGVKTMVVEKQPLRRTVRAVGRVDYDETRIMDVNMWIIPVSGWKRGSLCSRFIVRNWLRHRRSI